MIEAIESLDRDKQYNDVLNKLYDSYKPFRDWFHTKNSFPDSEYKNVDEDGEKIITVKIYDGEAIWKINHRGESMIVGAAHNPLTLLLASLSKRLGEDLNFVRSHYEWTHPRKKEILDALGRLGDYLTGQRSNYPSC
jgi:hypothetical protein